MSDDLSFLVLLDFESAVCLHRYAEVALGRLFFFTAMPKHASVVLMHILPHTSVHYKR